MPGKDNIKEDCFFYIFNNTDSQLNLKIFKNITHKFGAPKIDYSASRINRQLQNYVSWKPGPETLAIYALSFNWSSNYNFTFPRFSL